MQKKQVVLDKLRYLLRTDTVILDTETTGLSDMDEVIELGIIDLNGQVLYHSYFNPLAAISSGAQSVHGLTKDFLRSYPRFDADYDKIRAVLADKNVVIYNSEFDNRLLRATAHRHSVRPLEYDSVCMMHLMMDYLGSERYISLEKASGQVVKHGAISDCLIVLDLMKRVVSQG